MVKTSDEWIGKYDDTNWTLSRLNKLNGEQIALFYMNGKLTVEEVSKLQKGETIRKFDLDWVME